MKFKAMAAIALASLLTCASAIATEDDGKTIQGVGVGVNQSVYVTFNEPLQVTCAYNTVNLGDPNSAYTKALLAIVLTAEASSRPVRVVYSSQSDGTCVATLISA